MAQSADANLAAKCGLGPCFLKCFFLAETVMRATRMPWLAPIAMTSVMIGPGTMSSTAVMIRKAANKSQWRGYSGRRISLTGEFLNKCDDSVANAAAFDLRVRPDERQSVGGGNKLADMCRGWNSCRVLCCIARVEKAFEKEWNWHLKEIRDVLKLASADSIGAFLVFLDLLKRETELASKLCLAQA